MQRNFNISIILIGLLAVTSILSLLFGAAEISLRNIFDWISGQGEPMQAIILGDIRAPRITLAALVGFVLGLGGASVQGLLRNPLAEPSLLGASNAAALGAVLVIYLGLATTVSYAVPIAASLAALASVGLLALFTGGHVSSIRLILAGFAVSALAGAGIALALNLSPNVFAALEISFWLLGAVENSSWQHVYLALPGCLVGALLMLGSAKSLNALSLGDDVARSLGVGVTGLQWRISIGLALAIGSAVAATGVIGFVGLVAPHMARRLTGYSISRSLLVSGLLGAILLVAGDSLIRSLPTQTELKLGVLTAFLGVPMLLYLLRPRGSKLVQE
ncbi:iron ABC transporter permease [Alphaproteobacteria bacterium]|nr:iron ABC transporter permease [Alphaproteobacteria bacterium]